MSEEGIFYSQAKGFHMLPLAIELVPLPNEDFEQQNQRLGYQEVWYYGDRDLDHVECLRSSGKVSALPMFQVVLNDVNSWETVYITNEADLLAFRMNAMKAFHKQFEVAELLRLAQRVFCLWHGHGVYGSCRECKAKKL
jgi:hypothetical protein